MQSSVHGSAVYNSQDMEASNVSFIRGTDRKKM